MEKGMNDDLRTRYDALTANIKQQREQSECGATPQLIAKRFHGHLERSMRLWGLHEMP